MLIDSDQPSYKSLRDVISERTSPVVAWVGSGLSAEAGLPTWSKLREALLATCSDKIATLNEPDRERKYRELVAIKDESNNWVCFQRIKKFLGSTSYSEAIRQQLSKANNNPSPQGYKVLWELGIRGLINFNLDRLGTKAFWSVKKDGTAPIEFTGRDINSYAHTLKSPSPFILNLHGIVENSASWILTHEELKDLVNAEATRLFLNSCFLNSTIIFCGIGVDDEAIRDYLRQLKGAEIDFGAHYWFTHRRDDSTDRWAENYGIRLIRYKTSKGKHSNLRFLLEDLRNYRPTDKEADPVTLEVSTTTPLPEPEELLHKDAESIRKVLNATAVEILGKAGKDKYKEFMRFCREYDEAIFRAWYTSTEQGKNDLLGYVLLEEVAVGAFGRVYRAEDPNGEQVAVKVLKEDVRNNPESLQSFRRGVRSMRILRKRNAAGMIGCIAASEIPAFVVMDWVEGPTLREIVEMREVDSWEKALRIAVELAKIIQQAHLLPERVLHRDLRPSNVMLRDYWTQPDDWDVVVLDFDLSWHRGALEQSIMHARTAVGYLAPEQIVRNPEVSTRNAAVDSFGLGMTLFYIVAGRDPVPDEHLHTDWEETIEELALNLPYTDWQSIGSRYGRLIKMATLNEQARRWDLGQISGELERLLMACCSPREVESAELLAEEALARSEYARDRYVWEPESVKGTLDLASGVKMIVTGDESARKVRLNLTWSSSGAEDRKQIGRWLPERVQQLEGRFKRKNWQLPPISLRARHLSLEATIDIDSNRFDVSSVAEDFDFVCDALNFD